MGRIYLVRHGQADLLGDDYDTLSERGHVQAKLTGAALAAIGVDPVMLVSGALRRQSRTALAAAEGGGWAVTPDIDPDFDEYTHADLFTPAFPHLVDHAAIAGQVARAPEPRRAYQQLFEEAFCAWIAGRPGGSGLGWAAFRERAVAALLRVAERCGRGETAVIVTSGGVITAICQTLLHVPDAKVLSLHNPIHNASITRLLTRNGEVALGGFNDISHLAGVEKGALLTWR